ncbi:hypothetical protein [Ureaplasma diversum]|uniref:Transmembrane protein n=1 Tax=Ureaplasma diversum NCTC 246 TaxID=1188241 RepID=A0A084EZ29_9BACT|nr:hypothetical protein [Ureaplasma diversum]KEZ23221.1 hypothetical protein UDIV_3850 [Ureaplasma diversum NCTC 246]
MYGVFIAFILLFALAAIFNLVALFTTYRNTLGKNTIERARVRAEKRGWIWCLIAFVFCLVGTLTIVALMIDSNWMLELIKETETYFKIKYNLTQPTPST